MVGKQRRRTVENEEERPVRKRRDGFQSSAEELNPFSLEATEKLKLHFIEYFRNSFSRLWVRKQKLFVKLQFGRLRPNQSWKENKNLPDQRNLQ